MKKPFMRSLVFKWAALAMLIAIFFAVNFYNYIRVNRDMEQMTGSVVSLWASPFSILLWATIALIPAIFKRFFLSVCILTGATIWLFWWFDYHKTFFSVVENSQTPFFAILAITLVVGVAGEILIWAITRHKKNTISNVN